MKVTESPKNGRVPKAAWGLVVAVGVIWLIFGLIFYVPLDTVFGNGPPSAYSAIATKELSASSRLVAALLIMEGSLQIVIGVKPFRMGEKWAWYAYTMFPVIGILETYAIYLGGGELVFSASLSVVLPTLALLLSFRSLNAPSAMAIPGT